MCPCQRDNDIASSRQVTLLTSFSLIGSPFQIGELKQMWDH
jgi:hypothetical protein